MIGTQVGRERVHRELVARVAVDFAPAGAAATGTASIGPRELVLRYDVERSEPTWKTWVAAPVGMVLDAGVGFLGFFAGYGSGSAGLGISAVVFSLGALIADPIALIALAIPDDWVLPEGTQYLEPQPGHVVTIDVDGARVRAPVWIDPAPRWLEPVGGDVILEVASADRTVRVPLADPAEWATGGAPRVWWPPRESDPSALGLPFRIYELPTRPAACPLPSPLARHHRVRPGLTAAVRTGLVLSQLGDAFSVSSVDATTPASTADELLFEVDSDGRSDVVLRIDAAHGCPLHEASGPTVPGYLSVTVGDGQGTSFGGVDLDPRLDGVSTNYRASTEWVTIPMRRLPAGRHTLHLYVTRARRRVEDVDSSDTTAAVAEEGEYIIFIGRARPRPPPGEIQPRSRRTQR